MDNQTPSPNAPQGFERPIGPVPEQVSGLPERAAEQAPAPAMTPAGADAGPAATPTPPKLTADQVAAAIAAAPGPGASAVAPATTTSTANPVTAADVDVIEPEWVDKAEQVVQSHYGDPYGEEEAIEALQEDYLQKRYGIKVADPNHKDTKPRGA